MDWCPLWAAGGGRGGGNGKNENSEDGTAADLL